MQADLMKLIAYGKVMEDDNKNLKEYSIKEGDFLVVMISKVRSKQLIVNRQSPSQSPKQKIKRWRSPPLLQLNRIQWVHPHNSNSLNLLPNSNLQQQVV